MALQAERRAQGRRARIDHGPDREKAGQDKRRPPAPSLDSLLHASLPKQRRAAITENFSDPRPSIGPEIREPEAGPRRRGRSKTAAPGGRRGHTTGPPSEATESVRRRPPAPPVWCPAPRRRGPRPPRRD